MIGNVKTTLVYASTPTILHGYIARPNMFLGKIQSAPSITERTTETGWLSVIYEMVLLSE